MKGDQKLAEELMVFLQAFEEFDREKERLEVCLRKHDVSVKNVRGQIRDIIGVLETQLRTQEFILEEQKASVNRADISKVEKRRSIQYIQGRLDDVRENLELVEELKKGERIETE